MKVLFAVNSENISESIIKTYQSMYKEIISWKNVYFFNAIIKELQRDKSYDRIVIGEDLEPYANNNYEVIDNFLFDKLDAISDEASNSKDGDIPIILIASSRREKGDSLLVKLFGIGVYNVLLGNDRKIDRVCELIKQPRTKKEAKIYYKIESDNVEYKTVDLDSVSETEIQNIIRHYKKLGRDEEKYVESFNDIAEQYTDTQLKVITRYLPLNVRAVLEERSPKYQEVMIGSVKGKVEPVKKSNSGFVTKDLNTKKGGNIDLIDKEIGKSRLTKPVVIPSAINTNNVKKVYTNTPSVEKEFISSNAESKPMFEPEDLLKGGSNINDTKIKENPVEKRRGRPKKQKVEETIEEKNHAENVIPENLKPNEPILEEPKRGRGRPKKNAIQEKPIEVQAPVENMKQNNDEVMMPGFEFEEQEDAVHAPASSTFESENDTGLNLFNMADESKEEQENVLPGLEESYDEVLPNLASNNEPKIENYSTGKQMKTVDYEYDDSRLSNLLIGDKKIVAFVGTSKNGTSFLVNNLAVYLSNKGIDTAILDLTKNKNSYYIYTANDDSLRNKAFNCMEDLRMGSTNGGIQVGRGLSVYTTLPGKNESIEDYGNILETLARNHTVVLLDCDFETNKNYFKEAQEIYAVQTYDILTIQPLTAFLNDLKYKNILDQNKLRIVINKKLPLRKLTDQMIIGGISCFNDPASTYINTLFNKDTVRYTVIPFEDATYARYLERLVDCEISLKGYSKIFLDSLAKLADMVYPLIAAGKPKYDSNKNYNDYNRKNKTFNNDMNATLNKMRSKF